ncbi:dual specificity protein kinase yak1 [Rhizina undulata]
MDPRPVYSSDASASRQPRYANNVLQQNNTSPQLPRDFTSQPPQPASQQQQPQQQQGYQPYHAQSGTAQPLTSPTARMENNSDYMDVQMPDADSYRAKYQSTRQPYLGTEESSASQRYSPMNTAISPQASYSSSFNPPSTYNQMPSYQHRQSPSRPNYTSTTQSYYSQNTSSGSPRTSAPTSAQTYQHPLQQQQPVLQQSGRVPTLEPPPSLVSMSSNPNLGADANGGRYYPSSAAVPQSATFEQPPPMRQSPPRDPPPRFTRVTSVNDLEPRANAQPQFRRANPEGGFISPVQALTAYLPATYRICNPNFKYESSRNPRRVLTKPSKGVKNDGYDNEDSDYILYVNDILGSEETKNRYLILDVLGQGTFGQVVKCQNLKTQEVVAVKVVKNRTAYFNQSMMEVSVLDLLNSKLDKNDDHHILRLKDTFIHRQHLCLVFELLSVNLYELIKQNQFRGLSTTLVRVFAQQLLNALSLLNKARLIHCDLKPENILLKNLESPIIKVIDFGSACDERQTVYTYIQSRFYRSPEVLLGLPYSSSIDMWSLGCIVVELFLGLPLFPGSSEYNQVARITEMLGVPPNWMIEMGKQAGDFFEKAYDEHGRKYYKLKSMEQYSKEHNTKEQPSKKYFQATTLPDIIRQYSMPRKNMKPIEIEREMNNRIAFIDFVRGLLNLNPMERWSPQQAKLHPFITQQKYTGPFVPPMNMKTPPLQKTPMTVAEQQQQQRAEQAARQKQQQAAQQNLQQSQSPQATQTPSSFSGSQLGNYQNPSNHTQPPPVYTTVYNPPQHQQPAPPTYTSGSNQFPSMMQQQPNQVTSNQYQTSHQSLYPPSNARTSRQRSQTMLDGIPPQIQRAASLMDPTQPIRLQPSPAYFPPPPGGIPEDAGNGRGRRQSRGGQGQYRNRDVVRALEDRTLEDGLFTQTHW